MAYDALLLDFYGTLVEEDDAIITQIVTVIADASPQRPTTREVLGAWRFLDACDDAFGERFRTQRAIEIDTLQDVLDRFEVAMSARELSAPLFDYWQAPAAFPEAHHFMSEIERRGIPCRIVSNIDRADLDQATSHHGWAHVPRITSEDQRSYKPRPEMFSEALRQIGCPPERVLHVGDSWRSDVVGAKRRGIHAAWVNRKRKPMPESEIAADHVAGNLLEVLTMFS